jgi:tripartite ATP-independent transporter DctM subunit
MDWYLAGVLVFGSLFLLLAIGVPIFAALGIVSFGAVVIISGSAEAIDVLGVFMFSKLFNYLFCAMPLFFLMAQVLQNSGIGIDIYDVANKWVGGFPGGLAMASVAGSAGFGAMCGSTSATVATIGSVSVPGMLSQNYDKRLTTGVVAASGGLATLIPPSGIMILYAFISGTSIGQLFIAGIIPGILLALLMMASIWVRVKLNPKLAPLVVGVTWSEKIRVLNKVWPMLLLVFLVLITIYLGVCTVTEAAGLGAIGSIFISAILKRLSFSNLVQSLLRAAQITSFAFLMLLGALFFGYVMSLVGVTQQLTVLAVSLPVSKYVILIVLMVMYLFLGCLLENGAIVLITTPVVFPIIDSLGFDSLWWGVMLVINMDVAGVTPQFHS